ncbi:MAG TPA: gamma-glutamyl-gamma-aminobutyrate hydrolase family protein, partial [Kofleriaceae bacterium]|nr:gamma-glutamyl-gamma-aminobutyrate hydrolase family protein [Kofleriaceae bacterium]
MKTLIVDNHDSFTFNLLQLIGEVNGVAPVVVRNDEADWAEVQSLDFDNIVLSPGPGRPEQPRDFGICLDILDETRIPILGVCLGHQGIAHFFGGAVVHAQEPIHGRASPVHHGGTGLFHGIPSPFSAIRYHSLVCDASRLPACLEVTARTDGDLVMAVKHRERPIWGVQFHPESICTEHGRALLENFRELSAGFLAAAPRRPARGPRPRLRSIPQAPRLPARDGSVEVHAHRLGRLDAERVFGALFARDPRAFWLDSSLVEPGLSHFSFMGGSDGPLSASIEYRADSGELTVRSRTGTQVLRESIFDHLERELRRLECAPPPVPFDFTCGYVGYFGYELKRECGGGAAHRAVTPDA